MAKTGPGEIEVYRSEDGAELAVVAATWHLQPKTTFESLKMEFERDSVKAWRNYGSKLTGSSESPLRDPQTVNALANRDRVTPWDHERHAFHPWFQGVPGAVYFIHLDLAKNHDSAGLALCHRDAQTRKIVVDFMDGVVGKNGGEIQIADLRELYIYELTRRGFHIQMVSYDQWQSLESQQILRRQGYEVEECSADKTMEPYDTLFDVLLTGQLDYYLHPQFVRELQGIRRVGGKKYDHPKHGSKDVTDAVACATHKLMEWELENPDYYTGCYLTVRRNAATTFRPGLD
jgi:hypothetical protein